MQKKNSAAIKINFLFLFLTVISVLNINIFNADKTAYAYGLLKTHIDNSYLKVDKIKTIKTPGIRFSKQSGIIKITLAQAINRALANYGNILEAEHIISEKIYLKKAAYAELFPDIDFNAGGIWSRTKNGNPVFASANGMRELISQISLTVPIFNPKIYGEISLASNGIKVAQCKLRLARLLTAARITQYFYDIILLNNEMEIERESLISAEKISNEAKIGYKTGNLPLFDVIKTELISDEIKTKFQIIRSKLKYFEHAFLTEIFYNGNINNTKISLIKPNSNLPVINYKIPPLNNLISIAIKKQPLIKIAESEIQSAKTSLYINKAEKFPDIKGGAAYGEDTLNSFDAPDLGWQFFVMLNVPIYNFGLHSDYISAANEKLTALKYAEASVKLSVIKRITIDYGKILAAKLRKTGDFQYVNFKSPSAGPEIALTPTDYAAAYGISPSVIADKVKRLLWGQKAGFLLYGEQVLPVRVFIKKKSASVSELKNWPFTLKNGTHTRLNYISKIRIKKAVPFITHQNMAPYAYIFIKPIKGEGLSAGAAKARSIIDSIHLPPSVTASIGGYYRSQVKSFKQMAVMLTFALILIFVFFGFQFASQRAAIASMIAIALSGAGALAALLITGIELDSTAFLGILLVFAISTNNAILIFARSRQISGAANSSPSPSSVFLAARERLRPILMTMLADVFGFLPLAVGIGRGTDLLKPLSVAVMGGLLISVFMSLWLAPVIYAGLFSNRKDGIKSLQNRKLN
ncbi:MAG: efflux RND transporter permease subunit [Candidatus Acidulodesulfobacterium sp.]